MAERTPWWKAFTIRKKGGSGPRDPPTVLQDSTTETQSAGATTPATSPQSSTGSQDKSHLMQHETYDDLEYEPVFTESTCRRNMKISRSGRFREKRRIRTSLPENNNIYEATSGAAGKEGYR